MADRSELDIDAVLAARWADPAVFSDAEFIEAEKFWRGLREQDVRLLAIRSQAMDSIRSWTGCLARDVGSFGLQLNLETSDLDLGIGYPVAQRAVVIDQLQRHADFLGERKTRFSTDRLVFAFQIEGVDIDVSVLTSEDFPVACRMLDEITTIMTEQEKIAHTWVKHLLREAGRMREYAEWKLVTYARFCSEFHWVPIPEKI